MTTTLHRYQQQLLFAMRMRDIPGPRIAEALAEVDSHVAETGEDPYEAFGEPKAYAHRLSAVLEEAEGAPRRRPIWALSWGDALCVLVAVTGSGLLANGLYRVDDKGFLNLAAIPSALAGVLVLVALGLWMARRLRRDADLVIDPRTGRNLAPPFPRWTLLVLAGFPIGLLLLVYLVNR